jgi:molybdenum cofactor guanylyltransferase
MGAPIPEEVGGYILSGGKSSRMGQDKALLELNGKPLIRHAVKKLRRVCMDVRILSDNVQLEAYAQLVTDIHPGCGPMSGMEAALVHSVFEWNLFLAVDMPFLPTAFISFWLRNWLRQERSSKFHGAHVYMFIVDDRPQPGFCLVHKEIAPFLTAALERGQYKLVPVLEAAGRELALRKGFLEGSGFWCLPKGGLQITPGLVKQEAWCYLTDAQQQAEDLWFANLNTPEEFAEAESHVGALDT